MMCGGLVHTDEELCLLNYDYPLNEHERSMCMLGPTLQEPIVNDVPTDKDKKLVDFDMQVEFSKDDSNIGGMRPDVEEEYY